MGKCAWDSASFRDRPGSTEKSSNVRFDLLRGRDTLSSTKAFAIMTANLLALVIALRRSALRYCHLVVARNRRSGRSTVGEALVGALWALAWAAFWYRRRGYNAVRLLAPFRH